jgi:hypothetical protein
VPASLSVSKVRNSTERGRRKDDDDVPPMLPSQLNRVILNSKPLPLEDVNYLPIPTNSVLNHLYACSIRDGVMAVGTTNRFRKKVIFFVNISLLRQYIIRQSSLFNLIVK